MQIPHRLWHEAQAAAKHELPDGFQAAGRQVARLPAKSEDSGLLAVRRGQSLGGRFT